MVTSTRGGASPYWVRSVGFSSTTRVISMPLIKVTRRVMTVSSAGAASGAVISQAPPVFVTVDTSPLADLMTNCSISFFGISTALGLVSPDSGECFDWKK